MLLRLLVSFVMTAAVALATGCSPDNPLSTLQDDSFTIKLIGEVAKTGAVQDIAFSSQDDRLVLTAGMDGYLRGVRVDTLKQVWQSRFTATLEDVAFSPDGERAVVVGNRATINIVETRTGRVLNELIGHANIIRAAAFSPDGAYIATGSSDSTVMIWDAETGRDTHLFEEWAGSQVSSLVFSDDGRRLAGGINEQLVIWDIPGYKRLRAINLKDFWIEQMKFSPGMAYVALIGSVEDNPMVMDMETERLIVLKGHTGSVRAVAFSMDHSKLITGGADKTVRIWDIASGRQIGMLDGFHTWVTAIAMSKDGQRMVVADLSMNLKIYEVNQ